MVQQLADRDPSIDREVRQVGPDGRIECEPAVVDKGQDERGGERLRDAGGGEGRGRMDRATCGDIGQAGRAGPGGAIGEQDRGRQAGDPELDPEPIQVTVERGPHQRRGARWRRLRDGGRNGRQSRRDRRRRLG
jgi:hypothetical protein